VPCWHGPISHACCTDRDPLITLMQYWQRPTYNAVIPYWRTNLSLFHLELTGTHSWRCHSIVPGIHLLCRVVVTGTHISLLCSRESDPLTALPCLSCRESLITVSCYFVRDPLILQYRCVKDPRITLACRSERSQLSLCHAVFTGTHLSVCHVVETGMHLSLYHTVVTAHLSLTYCIDRGPYITVSWAL
jgi:hypothetical protein